MNKVDFKNIKLNIKTFFQKVPEYWDVLKKHVFFGITRRWLINVFGMTMALVVLLFSVLSMVAKNVYYTNCANILEASGEYMAKYFEDYVYPQYRSVSASFMALVEDFEDKGTMEMQVISLNGSMIFSSTGFAMEEVNETPDLLSAQGGKKGRWFGYSPSADEQIVSISLPLYTDDDIHVGSLRMMSSLTMINGALRTINIGIFGVAAVMLLLTVLTGSYFIKSIVLPVGFINETALKIAEGDMTARVKESGKEDEIARLAHTINQMAEELSQTEKLKNDFISSISHELRTPLTAIRGWTETMLAAPEQMDETTHRGMEIIYSETERLSKMVEELLDMSRLQSGNMKLAVEQCDLLAEFEETVFMMSERGKSEQIIIEYVPEEESILALVDRDRIKQVFFNIIDNAIKHSYHGGRIEVAARVEEQNALFIVQDFGEGIDAADLPHIKDMFYKGKSQKRGSGIGLGISDEIIRLHGGSLEIESAPKVGTVVTVSLPVLDVEEGKLLME